MDSIKDYEIAVLKKQEDGKEVIGYKYNYKGTKAEVRNHVVKVFNDHKSMYPTVTCAEYWEAGNSTGAVCFEGGRFDD